MATFDASPSPNQITNSEASTMRGTALAALMNGASTSARYWLRPRITPKITPATAPMANPNKASSTVTHSWYQMDPKSVPCANHSTSRSQMRDGFE